MQDKWDFQHSEISNYNKWLIVLSFYWAADLNIFRRHIAALLTLNGWEGFLLLSRRNLIIWFTANIQILTEITINNPADSPNFL